MNWLDIVLLLILAASVMTSFRKGLVREVIGLASVVAGLLLGAWFYGTVAAWFAPHLSSPAAANFCGFLVVFFGVVLLGSVIRGILGKFLKVTGLSFFDHLLGAGFGLLRGLLIAVALIMALLAFSSDHKPRQAVVESRLAPYIAAASSAVVAMAPQELKDGFHKTYAQVEEAWTNVATKKRTDTAPDAEKGKK